MFKIIHYHANSKNLTFSNKEFKKHLENGDIRNPEGWDTVLVIFGLIKFKL